MRFGFIGPAGDDLDSLSEAIEFFVSDVAADQVIYLGDDGAADRLAEQLIQRTRPNGHSFLDAAAAAALGGSANEIDTLLRAEEGLRRLDLLRVLPPPPLRSVEMVEERIVLMVLDKSVLGEEDIVNANVIVYGRAKELGLKRFGTRYFFTPGPLSAGCVGVVEREDDGQVCAAAFDLSGRPLWRERLQWRSTRMSVV